MKHTLTAEAVERIALDCLFRDDEIVDGKPPADAVMVEGMTVQMGFHPGRLESHRDEIADMIAELPPGFHKNTGGGWSALNACVTKDDEQWGEQSHVETLFCLARGLGLAGFCLPREMWPVLPGGMPYVWMG